MRGCAAAAALARQSKSNRDGVRNESARALRACRRVPLTRLRLSSLTLAKPAHPSPARGEGQFRARASLQQIQQRRDQRHVGGRHRVVLELGRPHPGQLLALRSASTWPSQRRQTIERHQQMELLVGVRGEGEGREAGLLDVDAELFAAARGSAPLPGFSPSWILPPGNSHRPAIGLPSGRWASSTRPSESISATATTVRIGLQARRVGTLPARALQPRA